MTIAPTVWPPMVFVPACSPSDSCAAGAWPSPSSSRRTASAARLRSPRPAPDLRHRVAPGLLAQAALMVALVLPLAGFSGGRIRAPPPQDAPESPREPPEVAAPRIETDGRRRDAHAPLLAAVYRPYARGWGASSSRSISSPSRWTWGSTSSTRHCARPVQLPGHRGTILTGTMSDYIGRELSPSSLRDLDRRAHLPSSISSPHQGWLLWLHACFFGLTWGARGRPSRPRRLISSPAATSAPFSE